MPEDVEDKLDDFELMLEGFALSLELNEDDRARTRLLSYWYSLKSDLKEKLNGKH